jgi:hypothetical protein
MNLKTGALLLLVGSMGLLAACGPALPPQPKYALDKKVQQDLFFRCLKSLPAGPIASKYNDWDEVVSECGSQAFHMARTCVENCS